MEKPTKLCLKSPAFEDQAIIPAKYTCQGDNINPSLQISGVPKNTQSLALITHDPDAVSGDFVHWLIWNIPPETNSIAEGGVPLSSVEGMNSFGATGYGGPCPPEGTGTHRYIFELYALDTTLNLDQSASREDLHSAMANNIIGQSTLTGLFGTG